MSKPSASKRQACALCVIAMVGISLVVLATANRRTASRTSSPSMASQLKSKTASARERYQAAFASLPLAFERNQGQSDPQVKYLARANGYNLFLTNDDAVFAFHPSHPKPSVSELSRHRHGRAFPDNDTQGRVQAVVHMRFVGGNSEAQTVSEHQLPGTTNYYLGNDPRNWHSNISRYGRVVYKNVYPGINLAYYGEQKKLEFDFVVAPQSDPTPIDLAFSGAQKLATDASGDLIVSSPAGDVVLHKPLAYQQQGGARQTVDARFALKADNQVSFELGKYDRSRELVIDPSLTYGTYLGGVDEDEVLGIAVDSANNIYVTGQTDSTSGWPAPTPMGTITSGVLDAFVTKLDSTGAITYTTFVGGSAGSTGSTSGRAIAVDSSQSAYVAGITQSVSLPATGPQPVSGSSSSCSVVSPATAVCTDAFAFKLNANGQTLAWATYIGGDNADDGYAIAVDGSGNTWVGGDTFSADFFSHVNAPPPLYTSFNNGKGPNPPSNDGFVVEINPAGTSFLFGTYLGGSFGDQVNAIAVDSSGNVYAAGETNSSDFPTTTGAYQTGCGSNGQCNISGDIAYYDAFVTKITPGASALTYSTYIGGSSNDYAYGIAVDSLGDAYITGETTKDDTTTSPAVPYPTTVGAFSTTYNASATSNAFVTELNPLGVALVYSTFLGGSTADIGGGIAVDGAGNAYVTGMTSSTNFPKLNPTQASLSGTSDAFVTEVLALPTPAGSTLGFSTYLGGTGVENASPSPALGSIALDGSNNIWVGGSTTSTNFPTAGTPAESAPGGGTEDGFVAEYSATTAADFSISATELVPATVAQNGSATSTVTITSLNAFTGSVSLACSIASGPSSPTSPPTCTFSPSSTVTGGSGSVTMTVSTTGTTTLGAYEIEVTGTGPSTNHSVTVSLGVSAPNFSITATTPAGVAPGSSGTSTITLTAIAGYNSPVNLSCAVTGSGTPLPQCSITGTTPVTPTAIGAHSTATITTTGPSGSVSRPRKFFYAMWLPIAGLALVGMGFTTTRSRRKKLFGFLILGMMMTVLFLMPACGGSSSSSKGGGTCAAAPSVPAGLAASSTTATGTTLTWTASTAGANCSVSSYSVYQNGNSTAIGTPTTPTFAVTGLTPATPYTFTVAATDSAGTSAQSSPALSVMTASAGTSPANYTVTITAIGTDSNATTHTAVVIMTVN
ncbi:MAG: SBBP repeat-containing protein [Candidatus Sulfotelmatobacter sp.]